MVPKAEIVCVHEWSGGFHCAESSVLRFRVDLIVGRRRYMGEQTYLYHKDALRAAKAAGAKEIKQ